MPWPWSLDLGDGARQALCAAIRLSRHAGEIAEKGAGTAATASYPYSRWHRERPKQRLPVVRISLGRISIAPSGRTPRHFFE